jgi:iron transport multicopper oxidase
LRGPLIIYDPQDPQKHMYDIDDGMTVIFLARLFNWLISSPDDTVITLGDWYHYLSTHPEIPP